MRAAPKRLSTAMRIALNDLRKVEKDPRYTVDMDRWHRPMTTLDGASVCHVCFAGAVMAKTCGLSNYEVYDGLEPEESSPWDHLFLALDSVRRGQVLLALNQMRRWKGIERWKHGEVPVTSYINKVQWRKDMFKIVHLLERIGE